MSFAKDHPLNNEQVEIINQQEYKEISTLYHKVRAGKDPDTKQLHITEEEISTLYHKVRAGKDPDTKQLHITEEEFTQEILQLIEKAKVKAELDVITAAWENSCTLPDANTISRSLANKRRYLEDKLVALRNQTNHIRNKT